jgi:hypothetical protein
MKLNARGRMKKNVLTTRMQQGMFSLKGSKKSGFDKMKEPKMGSRMGLDVHSRRWEFLTGGELPAVSHRAPMVVLC